MLLLGPGLGSAAAAPLAHQGSVVVSGEWDPHWSSLTLTPAVGASTGVGPSLNWMEPELGSGGHGGHGGHGHGGGGGGGGGHGQELWSLLSVTQRLQRWNGDHYQANLWAGVGAGLLTLFPTTAGVGDNRPAWSPWAQVDWETRRLYLGASARWFQAPSIGRLMTSARAGVALTGADYHRLQPWLMLEARTMEGLQQGVEITPLLRVLHRRLLAEAGISTTGSVRVTVSYTF